MARNMTGVAEVMARGGYRTHFVGKWDVGMASPDHTPAGRGYSTSLSYYHHSNDYYTFQGTGNCNGAPMNDLWNWKPQGSGSGASIFPGRPAKAFKNDANCTAKTQETGVNGTTCVYEDAIFEQRVKDTIAHHDAAKPLFLFWATHTVHGPLQVPDAQLANFTQFIDNPTRATYHAMVNFIDGSISRVVDELKAKGMYDNTVSTLSLFTHSLCPFRSPLAHTPCLVRRTLTRLGPQLIVFSSDKCVHEPTSRCHCCLRHI